MEVDIVRALTIPDRPGQQQKERRRSRSRRFKGELDEQMGEEGEDVDDAPEDSADFLPAVEALPAKPKPPAQAELEHEGSEAPPVNEGFSLTPHIDLLG